MISCRSLDVAQKAVEIKDWRELKPEAVRRVTIKADISSADISSADKGKTAHYQKDKTLVNAQGLGTARLPEGVSGGMVRGMSVRAGARTKDKLCSFGSIDCTEESLAQAFNKT